MNKTTVPQRSRPIKTHIHNFNAFRCSLHTEQRRSKIDKYTSLTFLVAEQLHVQGSYSLRYFWVLMGFLVVAPLSCFQSLNALKYTSSLSMIFIMFLAVIVVLFAFPTYSRLDPCLGYPGSSGSADAGICTGAKELYHIDTNSLRALSVFVFGYTCQQVLFLTAKS